jgi:hypothetical protein
VGWSLFGGHSCDPADVRRGHCPKCGTSWHLETSEAATTAAALRGHDIRDERGERLPLF